ncbi:MAG: hypothetical protein Kow00106_08560 [Anaerolineae bacterium]
MDIDSLDAIQLDSLLMAALQQVEQVGELPISQEAFLRIAQVVRREYVVNHRLRIGRVWPALFVTTMVFSARYSEEDVRKFWDPYARLVWDQQSASPYFTMQCRTHFEKCRRFLADRLDLAFPVRSAGDVVRPIFWHAIIPAYLQSHFASWLVSRFQDLAEVPADALPAVLRQDTSLEHAPPRLKQFIQDADTADTAAGLIAQMAHASRLYIEGAAAEEIEARLTNPIQRALWNEIAKALAEEIERQYTRKTHRLRLEWVWSLEDNETKLRLTNFTTGHEARPDVCVWAEHDRHRLLTGTIIETIDQPWKREDGSWLIDEMFLTGGPTDGQIYVLSERHEDDHPDVIDRLDVPSLPDGPVVAFRITRQNTLGVPVDLDAHQLSDGEWLLSMADDVQVVNAEGVSVQPRQQYPVPDLLRERRGHRQAGQYPLSLPVAFYQGGQLIARIESQASSVGQPFFEGANLVRVSPSVPPVFLGDQVQLVIPGLTEKSLKRLSLSIKSGDRSIVPTTLHELQQRGQLQQTGMGYVIDLGTIVPDPPGTYLVNLRSGLRSITPEPLQFTFLPGFSITPPDPDGVYSPVDEPRAFIQGVRFEQVNISPKVGTKRSLENGVEVTWHHLASTECRVYLEVNNQQIPLAWRVKRVFAWVDGLSGDGTLRQAEEAIIYIRGERGQSYRWRVGDESCRERPLDAKGCAEIHLRTDRLLDMLDEQPHTRVPVHLAVGEIEWQLFEYVRQPDIRELRVSYDAEARHLTLRCQVRNRVRQGDFTLQLRNRNLAGAKPIVVAEFTCIDDLLSFGCELGSDDYLVEILSDGEPLELPDGAGTLQVHAPQPQPEPTLAVVSDALDNLYRLAISAPLELKTLNPSDWPPLRHLIAVNDVEMWLQHHGLLPAWAVTCHPLTFMTRKDIRPLRLYPEVAFLRGRAGKGIVQLKVDTGELTWAVALWDHKTDTWSRLRILIPTEGLSKPVSELSEDELDDCAPAQQCARCGWVVGNKHSYILSPRTRLEHRHGYEEAQFRYVAYLETDEVLWGHIVHDRREPLPLIYAPDLVIDRDYALARLRSPVQLQTAGEAPSPITAAGYRNAVTEWTWKYHNDGQAKQFVDALVQDPLWQHDFGRLRQWMDNNDGELPPAFAAANRLLQAMTPTLHDNRLNLDHHALLFALLLRARAHDRAVREKTGLTDDDLRQMLSYANHACPLLLEWALTWVELFYVHAAS